MNEREGRQPNSPWIEQARRNAQRRGGFMAGVFADYQERFHMTDEELARRLGCNPDQIPAISLCQEPRLPSPKFATDVREIAAYGGADPGKLAEVVREVNQLRRWTGSAATAGGIAAAARDAEVDGGSSVLEDRTGNAPDGEQRPKEHTEESPEEGKPPGPHADPGR